MSTAARLPHWPGWAALPRDARDTLFLLGVIGWTILPHLGHLPWWCGALTALVLAWRALLALRGATLPGRSSVVLVLAVAAGLTWFTHRTLLGKEAGITMLVVLMALKTLELRARRDALVVFFLGFFLVLTHFLYSQSLLTALAMLGSVWGLLTALVLAHMPVGRPAVAQAGRLAARAALLGAPIMLALFLLFPRIGPLWGVPQDTVGRTGLSSTMQLGHVAELAQDDAIAFRIRFLEGQAPGPQEMYFRGPVLSRFDGIEWKADYAGRFSALRSGQVAGLMSDTRLRGNGVSYEVTLEPIRLPLLPLLELTPPLPEAAPLLENYQLLPQRDLVWRTDRLVAERVQFTARAWPQYSHGARLDPGQLRELVELPNGYNPRTLAWAAELRRDPRYAQADARSLARLLYQHIRQGSYSYTLSPGTYGKDAVDEFWLDRKEGFCEHYAAAFVVLMRAMDVPARIVTGYQGSDPFPQDGYFVVRQSHAHAWAEFWQPGEGWVRADPTAAVAPERIHSSRQLSAPPGLVADALQRVNPELLADLRSVWETMDNRWNQWVMSYSRTQQFDLLGKLGVQQPDWADLGRAVVLLMAGAALAGAAWAWWDRHRQDPWQRLLGRARQRLAALGVPAQPHHGPQTLAALVRQHLGAPAEPLAAALLQLSDMHYGRHAQRLPQRGWWRRFQAAAKALPTARAPG